MSPRRRSRGSTLRASSTRCSAPRARPANIPGSCSAYSPDSVRASHARRSPPLVAPRVATFPAPSNPRPKTAASPTPRGTTIRRTSSPCRCTCCRVGSRWTWSTPPTSIPPRPARRASPRSSLIDAMAPTNTLARQSRRASQGGVQTGGKSVTQGLRNMSHDVRYNGGWPSQVDCVGLRGRQEHGDHAGKVVYRSDLIELIQYEPQTPSRVRHAAAVLPAVDQQVLHHGSRAAEESDRMGGAARAHVLRDQLPQSRRVDARHRRSRTIC